MSPHLLFRGRQGALVCLVALAVLSRTQAANFLFDATKAEMAGNADWVIDADAYNLNVANGNGSGTLGTGGNESNPQRFPTPDQTNVTASTSETYWQGALSAWAIDIVKNGHHVETLPYNGRITWNDSSNVQDLTNYNVFVLCEPNIYFTATEKTALINFVKNGVGLFIVSDHSVADRNNDGSDAYQVLNDLMTNSVANNPFGIRFNGDNVSPASTYPDTSIADPITHGAAGTVTSFAYHNGSTISINTNQNASAKVAFWTSSTHGTNNAMIAYATFGTGKVVAIGDSSPFDDGTGDPNDTSFYVDYPLTSVGDGDAILNASLWLAQKPPVMKMVSLTTNLVQLSWPLASSNYSLLVSTNLVTWSVVSSGIRVSGTNLLYTNSLSGQKQFFRLKQ
ncbi:MAG: hypothetical protein NTZ16_13765 [Verrucomicrobia bacterium]|nr:hypothetical protein [Verrucomicrobiota bacterium]